MTTINFGDGTNIIGTVVNEHGLVAVSHQKDKEIISLDSIRNGLAAINEYIKKENLQCKEALVIDEAIESIDKGNIDNFKKKMGIIKDKLLDLSNQIGIQVISQYFAGALLK